MIDLVCPLMSKSYHVTKLEKKQTPSVTKKIEKAQII